MTLNIPELSSQNPMSLSGYVSLAGKTLSAAVYNNRCKVLGVAFGCLGVWLGASTGVKLAKVVRQLPKYSVLKGTVKVLRFSVLGLLLSYDFIRTGANIYHSPNQIGCPWDADGLKLSHSPSLLCHRTWRRVFWGDQERSQRIWQKTVLLSTLSRVIFTIRPIWSKEFKRTQADLSRTRAMQRRFLASRRDSTR